MDAREWRNFCGQPCSDYAEPPQSQIQGFCYNCGFRKSLHQPSTPPPASTPAVEPACPPESVASMLADLPSGTGGVPEVFPLPDKAAAPPEGGRGEPDFVDTPTGKALWQEKLRQQTEATITLPREEWERLMKAATEFAAFAERLRSLAALERRKP
jgi:hypothetical protein